MFWPNLLMAGCLGGRPVYKGSEEDFMPFIMEGFVRFHDETIFESVVKFLAEKQVVDAEGFFIDSTGSRIMDEDPNVDKEGLHITIPYHIYDNLEASDIFHEKAFGIIISISASDDFMATIIENGNAVQYDLYEWAKENISEPMPDKSSVDFDMWRVMVESEFLNNC